MFHMLLVDYFEPVASHVFPTEDDANTAAANIARARLLKDADVRALHDAEYIAEKPLEVWNDGEGCDWFVTPVTPHGEAATFSVDLAPGDGDPGLPHPTYATVDHANVRIAAYEYQGSDDAERVVIVDVDAEDTTALRVYLNDAPLHRTEK